MLSVLYQTFFCNDVVELLVIYSSGGCVNVLLFFLELTIDSTYFKQPLLLHTFLYCRG